MNCHNCGKINSAQAKFCGKCGYSLKALVEEETVLSQADAQEVLNEQRQTFVESPTTADAPNPVQRPETIKPVHVGQVDPVPSQEASPTAMVESSVNPLNLENVSSDAAPSATELKTLINSQFNNNYSNQAAIKRYLDAHTEQLKAITFQLESIKNFQATINYELIINEINDKYNAIAESINQRVQLQDFPAPENLESLLGEVDEKTHFLFEKINSLLLNHNHQLLNNFESVIQNVDHKNQATFAMLETQLGNGNQVISEQLKQFLIEFKSLEQENSLRVEANLMDHLNDFKQQNLNATLELQKKATAIEELMSNAQAGQSNEPATKVVDLVGKHIKSQALTGMEKITALMESNNKALCVSLGSELAPLLDKKINAMKHELLAEIVHVLPQEASAGAGKLSSEHLKKLRALATNVDGTLGVKDSEDEGPSGASSMGVTTFVTGILCGVSILLAGLSFYNFVQHEVGMSTPSHVKASSTKTSKHEE